MNEDKNMDSAGNQSQNQMQQFNSKSEYLRYVMLIKALHQKVPVGIAS